MHNDDAAFISSFNFCRSQRFKKCRGSLPSVQRRFWNMMSRQRRTKTTVRLAEIDRRALVSQVMLEGL